VTVETATFINGLDSGLPAGGDSRAEGDNHIRLLKSTIKATFPNLSGAVTPTQAEMNYLAGVTSLIQDQLNAAIGRLCEARLTAQSGVPLPLSDVTGATSLYFTPFRGNRVGLYYGSKWIPFTLTEISIDVPNANAVYDVFCYAAGGTTPTLELLGWASDTARATALTYQDGILVKSGDATRRYLGTIYAQASGGGIIDDTAEKRYVWNYYNRVPREIKRTETALSWLYSTTTWRQANANTLNQINFVVGVVEDVFAVELKVVGECVSASGDLQVAIGYDSTSSPHASSYGGDLHPNADFMSHTGVRFSIIPAVGKHYAAWLEWANSTFGNTFHNDRSPSFGRAPSGMQGMWPC
jgi:hypothetical protein